MEYTETTMDGVRFLYRAWTSDWNTINACGPADEYGSKAMDFAGKLVFDVGTHIGGFGIPAAVRGARVICMEPVPENVVLIRKNALRNGVADRVVVYQAAAGQSGAMLARWGYAGNENAEHHAFIGNTYHVRDTDPPTDVTFEEQMVPSYSLEEMITSEGVPDIIKIDCEGGEWDWMAEEAVRLCPFIVGEWHPVRGKKLYEFLDLLTPTHVVEITGPTEGPGGFTATLR